MATSPNIAETPGASSGNNEPVAGLLATQCRIRQNRLRAELSRHALDAVLLTEPGHVHYLTGYWTRSVFKRLVLIQRDGPTSLVVPAGIPSHPAAADEVIEYEATRCATLVDDPLSVALASVSRQLARTEHLACDTGIPLGLDGPHRVTDAMPMMLPLRRRKDDDEVSLLRRATQAAEAGLSWARSALGEGVDETWLFAGIQQAAVWNAGETLGEFGNDFQVGAVGSAPRRRKAKSHEIAIFDVSVVLRGYSSDMCRSFVVGGQPTAEQCDAHEQITRILAYVERNVQPGVRCRDVFEYARQQLDGYRGYRFTHHLGHGIGLSAHEAPRINPHYDDSFQIGDVFTIEPGLYDPSLKAGIRVENIYHLSDNGLVQLTSYPAEL